VLTEFFHVTNAESWTVVEMKILIRRTMKIYLLVNILMCIFRRTRKMSLLRDILTLLRCILQSIILQCAFIFEQ
jgi:hypothetical protein